MNAETIGGPQPKSWAEKAPLSWYKAVQIWNSPRKRYCNGRLSKAAFITIHVILFLFISLFPMYWFLIPAMIQNKINSGGGNGKVIISKLSIGTMNATSIPFSTNLVVTPLSSLPVRVGLNNLKFNLAHKSLQNGDFNDVATLDMPKDFDFWLNNDIKLDFEGQVSVSAEQASRGQVMLNNMFGESFGTRDELRLNFAPKISVYGMTLYRSLPLYRKLDVMGTVGNLEKIIASMKTKSTSEPSKIVFENPNYTGKELEKNYGSDQIMELPESFGKQKLVWKDLKMPMDDYSLGLSLAAAFENPTVFHVAKISSVEFYLKSQGEYLAKISLGKILLRPGLNEDFEIGVKVTFDDPQIDLVRTQDAIEKIATQFANTGDFEFAFAGPIKFGDAGFVQVYTKDIKISGKFSDLKRLSEKDTSESVPAGEDPTSTLKGYLGNSDISLAVVADKIMANLGLNLPSLSFVKPPAGLEFPYHAKMALYGESMKLLEFNSNPIVATRVQDGLLIKLGAEVKAENSPAAADEMAKILNPVLSLDPKKSKIGLKDFAFYKPGASNFKWCDLLFAKRILNIEIPAINKEKYLKSDSKSTKSSSGLKELISDYSLDVSQMDNTSGFTINGKVRLGEKAELPKLKIDVGYFGLQGTVESSDMIAFSLENGVKLGGGISEVDLKAKIVIAKGNQVASKFKNLGDCFLNDGAAPSYAGIRGLQLGEIKTFSKVAIDVKGSDLSVFAKKSESSSTSSTKVDLPDKAVKLKGIDLSIPSASEIFLAITATIANPFNIGLSLGAIEFAMLLDDNKLMTLSTAAFDLNRGLSDLDFSVRLTDVHDGGNGMSRKVATLAKYISEKSFPLDMKVGIQSLKLTRPNAVIDQFQDVTVKIPVSKLVKDKNQSASEKKVLDTSELFPSSASNTTKTTFNRFALEAAEGAKLKIAAEVIYQNAMKVSANVNFLSIITKIKEDTLADVNVDALKLSFQENLISPNVTIVFNKGKTNELLQDSVAQLVSEIQNERLVTKVGVNGFRFGSSDRPNNLFSEIALDLNSRISQESISNLNQKIKDIVKKLTDKSETKESSSTKLLLSKAHLLTKDSGAISLNVGAGIKDYKFPVSVSIGYFHVSNLINKLKLIRFGGDSSISVRTEGGNLLAGLTTELEFESDVSTQRSVGLFARDVLTKNEETKTELSISDFRFGLDSKPENTIDIFEKIVWTGSAAPLIKPLSNLVNGAENEEPVHSTGNTTTEASGIDFIVKDITVDVVETNTLQTDVDIQFFGFPTSPLTGGNYDLMVDLPYLSLALIWNDNLMLSTEIRNLKFARGALKTSIMAKFAENPAVHQSAFDVIGDLAFRRTRTVTDQAGGASLGFGSSFEKRVQTFQLIKLSKPIEKYVRKISDYNIKNNILYIDDLQNILMEQGIYAETRLSLGKKHLNMKAKIEAAATYQKDGKGPEAKLVDLQIVSIGAPTKLVMKPDLSKTGTAAGLGMVLEKLLSWKDFGSFAKVGYLKMTGSRGHKLNVFETASFPACPISMWDPIHADVLLIDPTAKLAAQEKSLGNPTAVGKAESFMIPIDAFISFRNAGPLHMDLGELAVEIKLDGKTLVKSKSFKNIVFRNKNEGADIPEPFINQGRFYTEIAADDLSLDAIKATIHKLVENKDKLDIIFQLKRDGVPIGYVGEILHQLLDSPALGDVGPLLGGVLAHIVATLLSEVPADAPSWPELNSSINKWMKSNFPNVRKLELPTNQSPSSFPVDLNGLFVHTSSKVVLESPQFKLVAH